VNPQPMKFRINPAAVVASATTQNTIVSIAIPIPVQRIPSGRKAQVMEIIKLQWDANLDMGSSVATTQATTALTLSSRSYGTTALPVYKNSDPFVIYFDKRIPDNCSTIGVAGAATFTPFVSTKMIDFTDGAGHGVLYGQDTLFAQGLFHFVTAGATLETTSAYNICLWYRWKNVGFSEYIGMVTAQ